MEITEVIFLPKNPRWQCNKPGYLINTNDSDLAVERANELLMKDEPKNHSLYYSVSFTVVLHDVKD